MKELIYPLCFIILYISTSCNVIEGTKYPKYSLTKITYVPDSLKVKHRIWITETIRASSQNMTGGDYEDVDVTIRQVKNTADELFEVNTIGLKKEINTSFGDDSELRPEELNPFERKIFDSLINIH